jgi:hypothetical protein
MKHYLFDEEEYERITALAESCSSSTPITAKTRAGKVVEVLIGSTGIFQVRRRDDYAPID